MLTLTILKSRMYIPRCIQDKVVINITNSLVTGARTGPARDNSVA